MNSLGENPQDVTTITSHPLDGAKIENDNISQSPQTSQNTYTAPSIHSASTQSTLKQASVPVSLQTPILTTSADEISSSFHENATEHFGKRKLSSTGFSEQQGQHSIHSNVNYNSYHSYIGSNSSIETTIYPASPFKYNFRFIFVILLCLPSILSMVGK